MHLRGLFNIVAGFMFHNFRLSVLPTKRWSPLLALAQLWLGPARNLPKAKERQTGFLTLARGQDAQPAHMSNGGRV
jgi:hypothetical protein